VKGEAREVKVGARRQSHPREATVIQKGDKIYSFVASSSQPNTNMELWRECAQWLDRLDLVPAGDPVLSSSSSKTDGLRHLVALLRDGTVLCRAADALVPGSVPMDRVLVDPPDPEAGRSVSDFLCRHNIFLFLHAAVADFHLNMDESFFQPEDLYHCRDLGRVLETLSAVSRSPRARAAGVSGFPTKETRLVKRLKRERGDYEEMSRLYGEAETDYLYDSFTRSKDDLEQSHYEDIYQT